MVAGARFSNFSTWRYKNDAYAANFADQKSAGPAAAIPPLAAPHREFDPTFGEFVLVFDGVTIWRKLAKDFVEPLLRTAVSGNLDVSSTFASVVGADKSFGRYDLRPHLAFRSWCPT